MHIAHPAHDLESARPIPTPVSSGMPKSYGRLHSLVRVYNIHKILYPQWHSLTIHI